MRHPSLYRLSSAALVWLAAVGACSSSGGGAAGGDDAPGGVADKGLIATPLGPAIADELILRLTLGRLDETADALAGEAGGAVVWRGPRTGAYLLKFADAASAARAERLLAARPEVLDVRRNLVARGTGVGGSPGNRAQWNIAALGFNAASGWGSAAGIQIAVLDTGVAYEDHDGFARASDLSGVTFVAPYDFVNDDAHPNDDHGHGTHVTGVIASTGPLAAVAPGVDIMPIKVLGADNLGTELALAEGILHAVDSGADVINLSLSFAPAYFPSRMLQEAVDQASAQGVLLVAAVGNHGRDVVTYPAAFRGVVAVAASTLAESFDPGSEQQPWQRADHALERAAYSNRGFLIDVTGPGGSIDRDIDGDGNPEAVLAQSFTGDPTGFEYVGYAGTSQAAAHVSGVAALMLARSPELTPSQVRALLGETTSGQREALSADLGRGLVSGKAATVVAGTAHASRERPAFSAAVGLSLEERPAGRIARAVVEVVDESGAAAAGVEVYGSFTGGVFESHRAFADAEGRVELTSGPVDGPVVAFQVEAVVARRGKHATVDRPGGFVRIDSCSLDLLSDFGSELAAGSGVGGSPGSPISLRVPSRSPAEVDSVLLLNFSWAMATPAMAVVADAGWFAAAFPEASEAAVVSLGTGRRGDPLAFDAATSFPIVLSPSDEEECVDIVVRTFSSAGDAGFLPLLPDPDGSCSLSSTCSAYQLVLAELWQVFSPGGVGGSPGLAGGSGMSASAYQHLVEVVSDYSSFAPEPVASPVGDYSDALEAAGIGAAPYDDQPAGGLGAGSAVWE